ncbi:TIGR00730 family Rossman fold protein [Bacillus horti]|uniref:Cytokinin riboside 5'-monophosphate phosphoribohydrolase n=1 Tax=Caldalkalibacillus horti TaxID=77523 RepID=A0ABT9VU20_9BACI|nr:TIGR00730 family Rossman fold protein [Bacillus horti]MDQ0164484.1 uncharacterized protein (TIGR00730 family) [Bacillus horti]
MINNICVFCGSSFGKHDVYQQEVLQLGKTLATKKINLIYGGGNVGLMGVLSRTVLENGGEVTGIIPKKIHESVDHIELTETVIVDTMHERKASMYSLADAFIALPGGIGTLEELAEVMTWQQIGYHAKPIGVFNINGFYQPFEKLLEHMVQEGFLKPEFAKNLIVEDTPEQLLERLEKFAPKLLSKWST